MSLPATDQVVDVLMPQMGTSITEGEVIAWLKQPGEEVAADEPICEISTDKVDSECPAPVAGTLIEILVAAGEVAEVGKPMGRRPPRRRPRRRRKPRPPSRPLRRRPRRRRTGPGAFTRRSPAGSPPPTASISTGSRAPA
jgi:pyruvate dehydrogenase E2 component (dihydrolipoamide acetyltransferase)